MATTGVKTNEHAIPFQKMRLLVVALPYLAVLIVKPMSMLMKIAHSPADSRKSLHYLRWFDHTLNAR